MRFFFLLTLLFLSNAKAENPNENPKKAIFDSHKFIKQKKTSVEKYLTPIKIIEKRSGLETVDCIYVINLERRPEKWEKMKTLFDERNLKVNRVNAIDGWLLSPEDQAILAGDYTMELRGGEIGCLLSHISVLKDAFERGFNRIWVCEDDIKFVDEIQKLPNLINSLTQIDPDWDILYTDKDHYFETKKIYLRPDQPGKSKKQYAKRKIINKELMTTGLRFGTHSFIVSKKGIEKILFYFTHVYLWCPIDCDLHYIPGIREYSCRNDIVTMEQENVISDTKEQNGT